MCLGKHSGRNLRRMVTLYLSAGEQRVGEDDLCTFSILPGD